MDPLEALCAVHSPRTREGGGSILRQMIALEVGYGRKAMLRVREVHSGKTG